MCSAPRTPLPKPRGSKEQGPRAGHLCPRPPPQPWEACWPAPMGPQMGGRHRNPSTGGKCALLPGLESSWRGSHRLGWRQGRGEGVRADTGNPQSSPARASAWRGAAHVASPAVPGDPNLPEDLNPHPRDQSTKPGDRPKPREMGPLMTVLQPNSGRAAFPETGWKKPFILPSAIWARTKGRVRSSHLGPCTSPPGQLAGRPGTHPATPHMGT